MGIHSANQIVKRLDVTENLKLAGSKLGSWEEIPGASKTLVAADSGKIFFANYAGAMTVTLPANTAALKGRWFMVINLVDQTLSIAAATADTLIVDGDIAADSGAYSTSSHKAGACALIVGTGSQWALINMSVGCTLTVATN